MPRTFLPPTVLSRRGKAAATRLIAPLAVMAALLAALPAAHADLPQHSGWPVQMSPGVAGGYLLAPMEGVALVNLTGGSGLQVVASSGDRVYVWDADAKAASGWPQTVQGTAQPPPSVGDLDGDGDLEVVQVGRGLRYSDKTVLHAWHHDGKPVTGWPLTYPNLIFNTVSLADLDGNGAQDLIIQVGRWPPAGSIEVRSGDGRLLGPTWKHELGGLPQGPAAVGDLDGDGSLEVVHLTESRLYVRRSDGTLFSPFPLSASSGKTFEAGVALADLDAGSAGLEIATADLDSSSTSAATARLLAYTAKGKASSGFPATLASGAVGVTVPTAGDVDGDGNLELVIGVRGKGIAVVSHDGKLESSLIPTLADNTASIQLVDLDGDGKLELLVDNNSVEPQGKMDGGMPDGGAGDGGKMEGGMPDGSAADAAAADGILSVDGGSQVGKGYLEAYEIDGTAVAGFPLRPSGSTLVSSASAEDLDGDGKLELVVVSTTFTSPPVSYVNLWSLAQGKAASRSWTTYAHDVRRSGCLGCGAASTVKWRADGWVPDGGHPDGVGADAPPASPDLGPDGPPGQGADSGGDCSCRLAGARPRRWDLAGAGVMAWGLGMLILLLARLRPRRSPRRRRAGARPGPAASFGRGGAR